MITTDKKQINSTPKPITTYREELIDGIVYRVTSVYQGKFELGKALEDLAVQKILEKEKENMRLSIAAAK